MIIGIDGSSGSLKLDCLTKIGAQLESGTAFCEGEDGEIQLSKVQHLSKIGYKHRMKAPPTPVFS
jgi:hypothetical protein